MEGPGLVRRKATLEAASLRKPHTFCDLGSCLWRLLNHPQKPIPTVFSGLLR